MLIGDDLRSGGIAAGDDEAGYDGFLAEMEALGLLSDLEDELPPGFTAIYEIARVLCDPSSELARRVAPALELVARGGETPAPVEEHPEARRVEIPAGEEYEAEFIRSWSDVRSVYAWQHLLPEEVFLRRLAQRTLWYPQAKSPEIHAITAGDDEFDPNPAKQKVYVLLDTSTSMQLRHRFALAKAVVLEFLRRNRTEMGHVLLRTFDVDVGPLHEARDLVSFGALQRRVTRQTLLGNGTVLERAVITAADDIHEQPGMSGAEILIVTDGAAHLREDRVDAALGDDIRLHCIKIGTAQVYASDAYLEETLDFSQASHTRRDQRVLQARDQRERLERALEVETSSELRALINGALSKCSREREELVAELRADYGHEIERLAHVYVEVPDLDGARLFAPTPEQIESLKELVARLTGELAEVPARAAALKQAALLLAHLTLLAEEQLDAEVRALLEKLHGHLEQSVESALGEHEHRVLDARLLSDTDQRDLRILLRRGTTRYSSLWTLLLRLFYSTVSRWTGRSR